MNRSTFLKDARAADRLQLITSVYLLLNILYILPFIAVYAFRELSGIQRDLFSPVYIYIMTLAVYDSLKLAYFHAVAAVGFSVLCVTQYTANKKRKIFVFSLVTAAADIVLNVIWLIYGISMTESLVM